MHASAQTWGPGVLNMRGLSVYRLSIKFISTFKPYRVSDFGMTSLEIPNAEPQALFWPLQLSSHQDGPSSNLRGAPVS